MNFLDWNKYPLIEKNAFLWIYSTRDFSLKKYTNVPVYMICNPYCPSVAVVDNKERVVKSKEWEINIHYGYYTVWATEDNDEKAKKCLCDAVCNYLNDKIRILEKQINGYSNIMEKSYEILRNV